MLNASIYKGMYTDPETEAGLAAALRSITNPVDKKVVLLCIGTDRNIPDSLGPLVGTMLNERNTSLSIVGSLDNPLHARNLVGRINSIRNNDPGCLELAIDASLGSRDEVGLIEVKPGGIIPGRAMQKNLPRVGDISILGKVGIYSGGGGTGHITQGRLNLVYAMARVITRGIIRWEKEQNR
ncbi:MAG: spore protease YyaC [Chitinophagales bacterium]